MSFLFRPAAMGCGVVLLFGGPAHSQQQLSQFEPVTLRNSIKCELGTFARDLKNVVVNPEKLKAKITIAGKTSTATSAGGTLTLPFFPVGGGGTQGTGLDDSYNISVTYNIHPANGINCSKKNLINTGVLSCLRTNKSYFLEAASGDAADSVACTHQVTASTALTANGKFTVWFVNVGPSFSNTVTRVYSIGVTAPAAKKPGGPPDT